MTLEFILWLVTAALHHTGEIKDYNLNAFISF